MYQMILENGEFKDHKHIILTCYNCYMNIINEIVFESISRFHINFISCHLFNIHNNQSNHIILGQVFYFYYYDLMILLTILIDRINY